MSRKKIPVVPATYTLRYARLIRPTNKDVKLYIGASVIANAPGLDEDNAMFIETNRTTDALSLVWYETLSEEQAEHRLLWKVDKMVKNGYKAEFDKPIFFNLSNSPSALVMSRLIEAPDLFAGNWQLSPAFADAVRTFFRRTHTGVMPKTLMEIGVEEAQLEEELAAIEREQIGDSWSSWS